MNGRNKPRFGHDASRVADATCSTFAIRFDDVEVRPQQRKLFVGGQEAAVGGRAFDLLLALIERRDRVVSRSELYDLVWPGRVVEENNLAVQVLALRRLLGTQAVATVPGRGYRFTLSLDGDEPPAAQQDRRRRPAPPPGAGPAPFVPPGPSPRMLGKV